MVRPEALIGSQETKKSSGGYNDAMTLYTVYDYNSGGSKVSAGKTKITCATGVCTVTKLVCCPYDNCDNGSVTLLEVNGTPASTTCPRLHETLVSCSNGSTIEINSSDDLKCAAGCW